MAKVLRFASITPTRPFPVSDLSETMFLISQAVKSDLPLGEAIRISLPDEDTSLNRRLRHFADLLDNGMELPLAAKQARLPQRLLTAIETAYASGDFSDYFWELVESERSWFKTFATLNNALMYPVLLFFIVILLGALFSFIVPMFEKMTTGFDTELPIMTKLFYKSAHILIQYGAIALLGLVIAPFVIGLLFPVFWYYLPGIGMILRNLTAQKVLGQLRLSFLRRIPLNEALALAGKSFFRNRTLRQCCLRASAEAESGTTFSEIIAHYPLLFPRWLAPFVKTAEKNDSIPSALRKGIALLEENGTEITILFGAVFALLCYIATMVIVGITFFALMLPLVKLFLSLSSW